MYQFGYQVTVWILRTVKFVDMHSLAKPFFKELEIVINSFSLKIAEIRIPTKPHRPVATSFHNLRQCLEIHSNSSVHLNTNFLAIICCMFAQRAQRGRDLINCLFFIDALLPAVGLNFYARSANVVTQLNKCLCLLNRRFKQVGIWVIKPLIGPWSYTADGTVSKAGFDFGMACR